MSQYSEIMTELAVLREQNTWLVSAVKHLLGQEVGWQAEMPLDELELDVGEDVPVPVHAPKEQTPCERRGHIHQTLDLTTNTVVCADCRIPLIDTGIVNRTVAQNSKADHFAGAAKG